MKCITPFLKYGCGQCTPCRINRRRIWEHRILLEALAHENTAFLTLTYDDENVPKTDKGNYTLSPSDLRDFWKRLRKRFAPQRLRYFAVGEYGHEGKRGWNPHYHAALYGIACLGKIYRAGTGNRCYCEICESVREVWGKGNVSLDNLQPESAAYICGYTVKKMTSTEDYRLDDQHPEFARMSLKPAIGSSAVADIATALGGTHGHLTFSNGDIPTGIAHGSGIKPLGQYLRKKIREALNMMKVNPETGQYSYGTPHEAVEAYFKDEMLSLPENYASLSKEEKYEVGMRQIAHNERLKAINLQKFRKTEARSKIFDNGKKL